jgi:hypothetical protein
MSEIVNVDKHDDIEQDRWCDKITKVLVKLIVDLDRQVSNGE